MLRDRRQLSADGILITVITISKEDGKILSDPDTISRGFVYVRDSEGLIREVNRLVTDTARRMIEENASQWNVMKQTLKDALGQFLYEKTKRRPMILPIIIEV